ncbi:hypothetical protein PILCRDRAFT_6370 [Piloderma croceum F 1598]|uniref:Uncharacterized protein n=1 Tax=Piloderma croceum (strain F 1598) TaxID=765440 RepID=A0A0C3FI29_PILCF|nr:hypothetical protein PILCRDRAFT_6370 [Piloderma croceum F 1598]
MTKDIENKTIASIGTMEVADGVFPLHHTWAKEVQLNGLKTLASNCWLDTTGKSCLEVEHMSLLHTVGCS